MYFKFTLWLLLAISSAVAFAQKRPAKSKKEKFHYLRHTKTPEEIRKIDNKLEKLYYLSLGEFSNESQAARTDNPVLKTVQTAIAIPIWRERTGEHWYYVGWFTKEQPHKPVTQLIYKLSKQNRDTFQLISYAIPNEAENNFYAYEWQKEKPFSQLSPKQLAITQTHDCPHNRVARGENEFELIPGEEFCAWKMSEQIYFLKHGILYTPEVLRTYTEFYDKNQKLVFAYPRPEGFELVRVDKNKPTFDMVKKQPTKHK